MDFYEVLNQIQDLLRSRGRVAYRALERQFDLDDDDIEALSELPRMRTIGFSFGPGMTRSRYPAHLRRRKRVNRYPIRRGTL